MKKIIFFPLLFLVANVQVSFAQSSVKQENSQAQSYVDIALSGRGGAGGKTIFSGALSWYRLHPVALKKRFAIGYGIRYTGAVAQNGEYVTAPAKVSEGNFFKKQNEAKLDTLVLPNSQVHALNASIVLSYTFSKKFKAGFNIDVLGFSFGGKQTGVFQASSEGRAESTEEAKVTNLNLLLTGDYDWGSLNSELYVKYFINEKMALRLGLSFLFTEYTTTRKLTFDNDRFRLKTLSPMIGFAVKL